MADDDTRGLGEVLAAVAVKVAAVPVVVGFVALGGVVVAGRAVRQVLGSRNGRRRRSPKARPSHPPASA